MFVSTVCAAQAEPEKLVVPAFTAYSEPDPESIQFSESDGVTGWKDKSQSLSWFGFIKHTGRLTPSIELKLSSGSSSTLKLTIDGHSSTAEAAGSDVVSTVAFKPVAIKHAGYYKFCLEPVSKVGAVFGDIKALSLSGPAVAEAHFNLKERRNAASVHLIYPLPQDIKAQWFYNEVTVKTDPIWSYYMACGFRRGYFGIQVNSPTERRIIFSIWDSGNEAVDRTKVSADDRVTLLAKGEGVDAGSFGNEGTGGHSHMVYPWKTGDTYRFLVAVQPDGTHTTYSGYFYFPEKQQWGLIARFRAPKDGGYLNGLYSFNENFGGANGEKRRLAEFGNQWIKTDDGKWIELTNAKFSHDKTGRGDRLDYSSGVVNGRFYLSNGGFVANGVKYGDPMQRPAGSKPPTDIVLPNVTDHVR